MKGFWFLLLMLCLLNEVIAQNNSVQQEHPIPWKPIREDENLWKKKRIWREIEVYKQVNSPLRSGQTDAFAIVLLTGIRSGEIKAYSNDDTTYKHPLTMQAIDTLIMCDIAGLSAYTRNYLNCFSRHQGNITIRDTSAIGSCTFPQQVEFYDIKEDWIFDADEGKMVVHIDGIAPVAYVKGVKNPLFWLHYPDIRSYINNYGVYDCGINMNLSWDGYFESRMFRSRITYVQGAKEQVEEKKQRKRRKKTNEDDSVSSHDVWVY